MVVRGAGRWARVVGAGRGSGPLGTALSGRLSRRPRPAWVLDLHRFLGVLAVVFAGVHLLGLVADSYVHFGPAELFVPLASSWRPGPVAWGVVALYLLLADRADVARCVDSPAASGVAFTSRATGCS